MSYFRNTKTVDACKASVGDDNIIKRKKDGEDGCPLQNASGGNESSVWPSMTNVLYLQNIGLNLLSMSALDNGCIHATFKK